MTDKYKICWAEKYITPQSFADIDYPLNYIGLNLLKPLQD